MTDSNKIQANSIGDNTIQANLTEQWKKGELPSSWYYVKGNRAEGIYAYTAEYLNNMYRPRNGERIITKVPTFDELQNINKSMNDLMASNIRLVEENTKLKELLKECRDVTDKAGFMFAKIDDVKKAKRLLKRIDEVLGEDK